MNASTPLDLLNLAPGERRRVFTHHMGLEYPGEVVAASAWEPSLGEPLQGDSFYRIVFLQTATQIDPQELRDARIAVCVPPKGRRPQERELEHQRRVLRELRTRYAVAAAEQMLQETQRQLYASGAIVTRTGPDFPAQAAFDQLSTAEPWVTIAQTLLAWTYPRLLLDTSSFPRPLTAQEAALVFRGLIQKDTAPDVVASAAAFGPGLGLIPANGPGGGPASPVRPVFQLIRGELEARGGSWPCDDLYQILSHVHGLPYPIVSLYLLAFLVASDPPCELALRPGHSLKTSGRSGYPGRVVLPETAKELDYAPRLDLEGSLLRFSLPASVGTIALYFACLDPSLAGLEQQDSTAAGARLMEVLAALATDAVQVTKGLERLGAALGEEMDPDPMALLEGFLRLGHARSPDAALLAARQLFGSPRVVVQEFTRYKALRQVAGQEDLLRLTIRYLREAYVPEEMQYLAFQRETLLATLKLGELTRTSFSLQALQEQAERFKREYALAYLEHHEACHQARASLLAQLGDADPLAQAVERLNTIDELGGAVGVETLELFRRLPASLEVCQTPSRKLSLARSPRCRRCGLSLGQQPPSVEVAKVVQQLERALKEQNRRLSIRVVQRILRGRVDPRVDRFIQVVQTSDLSGLANVLDPQLVAFLREVLSAP